MWTQSLKKSLVTFLRRLGYSLEVSGLVVGVCSILWVSLSASGQQELKAKSLMSSPILNQSVPNSKNTEQPTNYIGSDLKKTVVIGTNIKA